MDVRQAGRDDTQSRSPLRVAMIAPPWLEIPPPGYGGIENMCATLIEALIDRGHYVSLIGAGKKTGTRARFWSTNPRPQFQFVTSTAMPEITHAALAQRILESEEFDIVHDHSVAGPLMGGTRATPTVTTVHRPIEEQAAYYGALGNDVNLVAISESSRQQRPDLNWIGTVYNGISLAQFSFNPDPEDYVLWLGRFSDEKGPDLAIDICQQTGRRLILAGKVNEELEIQFLENVIKPKLGPNVELRLNVPREEVPALVSNASCLLNPIRWPEPFGMVVIEAMASGTPVLATRRGAMPEIIVDDVTGWVRNTPEALVPLLDRVNDLDRRSCRDHVAAKFSADVMAGGYEMIYHDLIASEGTKPPPEWLSQTLLKRYHINLTPTK